MGLDCFFQRSKQSPDEVSFPEGLHLCGGMFSGNGSEGSFRGKVYADFFESEVSTNLYENLSPSTVEIVSHKLARLQKMHPHQAWDGSWRPDAPSEELGYSGVTASELADLATLFQIAAQQHMKLVAWY